MQRVLFDAFCLFVCLFVCLFDEPTVQMDGYFGFAANVCAGRPILARCRD